MLEYVLNVVRIDFFKLSLTTEYYITNSNLTLIILDNAEY